MTSRKLIIGFLLVTALLAAAAIAAMRSIMKPGAGNSAAGQKVRGELIKHKAQSGDLIFQTAYTNLRAHKDVVKMINGEWNHCGILYRQGDSFSVFGISLRGTAGFLSLTAWLSFVNAEEVLVKRLPLVTWPGNALDIARLRGICNKYTGYTFNYDFDSTAGKAYPAGLLRTVMAEATGLQLGTPVLYLNFACGYTYGATLHRDCATSNADLWIVTPATIIASPVLETVYAAKN